jgi:ribosomal protein S18 acetylase RimI-like enzyme
MSRVAIRPMTADDILLLAAWLPEVPLLQRYNLTTKAATHHLHDALKQGDLVIVADLEPEAPCSGFAWCMPHGAFGRSAYLRWIGVHNDRAGSGLGTLLLRHIEQAATHYAPDLFLLVSDFNQDAQRFYLRAGYRQMGMLPAYILPDVTELIFWKPLSQTM